MHGTPLVIIAEVVTRILARVLVAEGLGKWGGHFWFFGGKEISRGLIDIVVIKD